MALNASTLPGPTLDIDHMVQSLRRARVETHPFTYLVCDDIFHPRDYANILAGFPPRSYFSSVAPHVSRLDLRADPASDGAGRWDIDTHLDPTRPEHQYWFEFRRQLLSDTVMLALAEALDIAALPDMQSSARLAIDDQDAGLGPHTDRSDKLMSAIFYLADDSEQDYQMQAGTQVLTPQSINPPFTQAHYTYSDFALHEYVAFKPNRLFAFKVANGEDGVYSFHGYHQAGDFQRRTIKYHIHNPRLVAQGIAENQRFKSSASDWLHEIKSQSKDTDHE